MRKRNTLILFAKAPRICRVKTRMWPALSHRQCLYLHKQTTQQLVRTFARHNNCRLILYTTSLQPTFSVANNVPVKLQAGINLGQRMHRAISTELKTSHRVVLIGSDCLELDVNYIESAFSKLQSDRDLVLGPANDGGYVLIGMNAPHEALFNNIIWGESGVLASTLKSAHSIGMVTHLLPTLIDADRIQDLQTLASRNRLPAWAQPLLHKL